MQNYDLWNGMALVGGLFSHTQLLQKHKFFVIFYAFKKSIDNRSFIYLKNALQFAPRLIGFQLVERIKKVGHAMIDLQRVSNLSNSMGFNLVTVNLQSHDQNIWDSVFEANSDLGWLHGNLDTCSS